MKALLKFDLSDPDDRAEYKLINSADGITSVLWTFLYNSRKGLERQVEEENLGGLDSVELLYKTLFDLLEDESINIGELWK